MDRLIGVDLIAPDMLGNTGLGFYRIVNASHSNHLRLAVEAQKVQEQSWSMQGSEAFVPCLQSELHLSTGRDTILRCSGSI